MKVILVTDYFYPHNPGGSEWSVYRLAKDLNKMNIKTQVITINYGSKSREKYKNINITRIPFYKKLKTHRSVVNPIFQNNVIFFMYSLIYFYLFFKKERPDLIHVHGKFLIPGAVLSSKILKIPSVITIRDKQMLCNIGKCFFEQERYKACDFYEFITKEIQWFIKNYSGKNYFRYPIIVLGSVLNRFSFKIVKFIAKTTTIIAISNSQKKYLQTNGFGPVSVIYNTEEFRKLPIKISKSQVVLFAGKISKGKGVDLLMEASNLNKNVSFIIAGEKDKSFHGGHSKNIQFIGPLSQEKLRREYRNSTVVVMPSVYPEAFGRVALEALSEGTPVIVSNIGALPEIVKNGLQGYVIEPNVDALSRSINEAIKNEKKLKKNINNDFLYLKNKFFKEPLDKHIKLYKSLMK